MIALRLLVAFPANKQINPRYLRHFCSNECARKQPKNFKHGMTKSPTYRSWGSAIARCERPSMPSYPRYGGRGITMCERWRSSFEAFLADMGERPNGTTLDRIDNDGHYEPGNCRWSTPKQQSANRTMPNRKLTTEQAMEIRSIGRSQTLRGIAAMFGVSHTTVRYILEGRTWHTHDSSVSR